MVGRSKNGFKKCQKICFSCSYAMPIYGFMKKFVTSTNTKCKVPLSGNFNCHTKNAIYLITCLKCHQQYVGQTGRIVKKRIAEHVSEIRTKRQKKVSQHFNQRGHELCDFSWTVLCAINAENGANSSEILKRIECKMMVVFDTFEPNGMN